MISKLSKKQILDCKLIAQDFLKEFDVPQGNLAPSARDYFSRVHQVMNEGAKIDTLNDDQVRAYETRLADLAAGAFAMIEYLKKPAADASDPSPACLQACYDKWIRDTKTSCAFGQPYCTVVPNMLVQKCMKNCQQSNVISPILGSNRN